MSGRKPAGRVLSEQPEDNPTASDQAADPFAVAREIALRQLTVRARSRAELAKALARKGVPEEAAEQVLDRLTEVGLIDDAAFAREWLATGGRRERSRRALMLELGNKGVDREIVAEAVSELDSDQDYAVARGYAERKVAGLARLDPQVRYRRLTAALARRGFPGSVVAQVVREVLSDWDAMDEGQQEV